VKIASLAPEAEEVAGATLFVRGGAVLFCGMTAYTIIPRPDQSGYDIAVVGTDGTHQTMLGFKTRAEADAWIAQDERLNGPGKPQEQSA
jgi:hypothetical protein